MLAKDVNITAQVKNKITLFDITIIAKDILMQKVITLNIFISLKNFASNGVNIKFIIKPNTPVNAINPPINVGDNFRTSSI